MFINLATGPFRVPFIAVSDYKYNHNPRYKEKIIKLQDEEFDARQDRQKKLKEQLNEYIQQDLASEQPQALPERPSESWMRQQNQNH